MGESRMKTLARLTWTPSLSKAFWSDLAGSDFLAEIAFSRFAAPYLVELVKPYFAGDPVVLDYGSGWNLYLVRELLRQRYRTAFYEPSAATDKDKGFEDLAADDRFLGALAGLTPGRFDVVFFSEVIEHLQDAEVAETLSSLKDALAPGGVLVVTTPNDEDLFQQSRYCPNCRHLFHPWGHVRSFSPQTLEELLDAHGLHCDAVWNVDFSSTRDVAEELISLKDKVSRVHEALGEWDSAREADASQAAALLRRLAGELAELQIEKDTRNPKRCQIGFGGTIVAVAKKD